MEVAGREESVRPSSPNRVGQGEQAAAAREREFKVRPALSSPLLNPNDSDRCLSTICPKVLMEVEGTLLLQLNYACKQDPGLIQV